MSLEVLVETLQKENKILKATLEAKDSIIKSLEQQLESAPNKVERHQSAENLASEIDDLSFGEKVALYVQVSPNTLSARDQVRRQTGKEIPYDPNPIGRLDGKEVVINKTDRTKFEEVS